MATYLCDAKQPVLNAKPCPPKLWSMLTPVSVPEQEQKSTAGLGESKETGACHPISFGIRNLNRTNCNLPLTGGGAASSIPLSRTFTEHHQEAGAAMGLRDFLSKQFIDVIDWVEPEEGILAYRYPMQDREIQTDGKLTVRDSQMAVFVNEGKVADAFAPGLYTLTTHTLPILTYLNNWDKAFQSPFKSDVYFFSTRIQTNQHWGTPNPITIRDKEFGAVRLRAFGIYTYHITDPKVFYSKVSGTRDIYRVPDLDGQLRNTIVGRITDTFAGSNLPFLDMAANQVALSEKIAAQLKPAFAEFGLSLDSFVVENLSLPDELQKVLDQRIGMNMVGDMGRYTQFEVAQAIP
jgi:membrane protease subunit (stomatin/prohibitin family)